MEAIYNPRFWTNLENLAIIIKPIYKAQKRSTTMAKPLTRAPRDGRFGP
jgi:hypothetical protein